MTVREKMIEVIRKWHIDLGTDDSLADRLIAAGFVLNKGKYKYDGLPDCDKPGWMPK